MLNSCSQRQLLLPAPTMLGALGPTGMAPESPLPRYCPATGEAAADPQWQMDADPQQRESPTLPGLTIAGEISGSGGSSATL